MMTMVVMVNVLLRIDMKTTVVTVHVLLMIKTQSKDDISGFCLDGLIAGSNLHLQATVRF